MLPKSGLYMGVAFSVFARIAQKADCICRYAPVVRRSALRQGRIVCGVAYSTLGHILQRADFTACARPCFGADWHCFYLISGLENLLSLLFFLRL